MIGEITNHLWQSTVFAAAVALVTLAFRKNRAEVRYWLWLTASLKFLVPFALLISLGVRLWDAFPATKISAPTAAPSAFSTTALQFTQQFPENFASAASASHSTNWLPFAILAVWASGFLAIALMRFRGWRRINAAIRSSIPLNISATVSVRSSAALLEPGVVGFLRPVLLLPEGIAKSLTPPQLEAVLTHEQSHVRRRDNLTSAIHMLVEAVFWFHPLVWWIGAKLVEERERACDETVLARGNEPSVYAEGILNVCKSYLESPLRCVSGVTGSDLKKRIRAILSDRVAGDLNFARKLALAIAATSALALPILVGAIAAPSLRAQSADANRPQFDVASIKRHPADDMQGIDFAALPGGTLAVVNNPVSNLITNAYGIPYYRFFGAPDWVNSDRYDIAAKGPVTAGQKEMMLMLQSLLAERFAMKAHFETRDVPAFILTVAKGGPKMQFLGSEDCVPRDNTKPGASSVPNVCGNNLLPRNGGWVATHISMPGVVGALSRVLGRPVIDHTGIKGMFDVHMQWSDDLAPSDSAGDAPPSFSTALRETLGLELKSGRGPAQVLVIDHIERPSGN
jgi:uncharacterized protein (TIGR03435 family)